jgi:2-polyprenyl-3-methyl-5-hydroxy-6-metoxy-1,4-benzoquinol methylase
MPLAFADFLQAKFALDERSLNREVRGAFLDALHSLPQIQCLDVGAGTCATFRRLLNAGLTPPLALTALDCDPALLDFAREEAAAWLRAVDLEPHMEESAILTQGERLMAIRFVASDLKDYWPDRQYNVITAHAVLDIVPLPDSLRLFAAWLQAGGYLYASINYDGETALLPVYSDAAFEARLLGHYNDTMERRRVDGQATGGAYCGRRLLGLLPALGFDILAYGSSDWNITPFLGKYRDGDAVCLAALLELIGAEGQSGAFRRDQLDRWREDRLRFLRQRRLGLIVHQLDLLARFRH